MSHVPGNFIADSVATTATIEADITTTQTVDTKKVSFETETLFFDDVKLKERFFLKRNEKQNLYSLCAA